MQSHLCSVVHKQRVAAAPVNDCDIRVSHVVMLREWPPKLCPRLRRSSCEGCQSPRVCVLKRTRELAELRRASVQPARRARRHAALCASIRSCRQGRERKQQGASRQVRAHSVRVIQAVLRVNDDHGLNVVAPERQRIERAQR